MKRKTETILKKQIEHLETVLWYFLHYDETGIRLEIKELERALKEIQNYE